MMMPIDTILQTKQTGILPPVRHKPLVALPFSPPFAQNGNSILARLVICAQER